MKSQQKVEYGDFQTPMELCRAICEVLRERHGIRPQALLEPTCGIGNFLTASAEVFPDAMRVGVEVNGEYLERIYNAGSDCELIRADFFSFRWEDLLSRLPDPLLVLGNPPWVTNTQLSVLSSGNIPQKRNFHGNRGIDAITGKSNFDISEWMLLQALQWLAPRQGMLAMLCKTLVARRVLAYAWKQSWPLRDAHVYGIDAMRHFGAAVDACLLVVEMGKPHEQKCLIHPTLASEATSTVGLREGRLIANVSRYDQLTDIKGRDQANMWRSGIKHDCSRVMELKREGTRFRNGFGELVELEMDYVYPMLKSSELANEKPSHRWMLVPQRMIGESTDSIRKMTPKTWEYLENHGELLDGRRSSIYRGKPRFSVFGVGQYSFSLWKVAISGFYKRLDFKCIGPVSGKPVVFDDTCYFLPCSSREDAVEISALLNSCSARDFFESLIFWDAKRPITAAVLQELHIGRLREQFFGQTFKGQLELPQI
jgi:hypothetical protein